MRDTGDKEAAWGKTSQSGPVALNHEQGRPGDSWGSLRPGHQTDPEGWGQDEASLWHCPVGGDQDPNEGGGSESAPDFDGHARQWGWSRA